MSESHARAVWRDFRQRHGVANAAVPLFAADDGGFVSVRLIGRGDSRRPVRVRSSAMEHLVRAEVRTLITD